MEGGGGGGGFGINSSGLMFEDSRSNNHHGSQHLNHKQSQIRAHNSSNSVLLLQDQFHNPNKNMTIIANSSGYFLDNNNNNDGGIGNSSSSSSSACVKAKIMSHPHYNRLFAAYISCQKIGAPPDVVARLEEASASVAAMSGGSVIGEDPALDQFMEAYCEMLSKYEQELSKPFKESMIFLSRIESQFKAITISSSDSAFVETLDGNETWEEEAADIHNNNLQVDPHAEDLVLKGQLLRKYSGCLGNLKDEFLKKRKKGKLPIEARQQLLEWWSRNYKWPYPSESQKIALGQSTGLDQKQINNWFINQRKRHWKPSEDMQFMVMDAANPHYNNYMADNVVGNHPFEMDISPPFL